MEKDPKDLWMPLVCWRMSSNISHKAAGQDVVKPRISELRRFTRAFQCLDRFFCTYLESSNIVKLSLKPDGVPQGGEVEQSGQAGHFHDPDIRMRFEPKFWH